jgi:membrane protein YdbS with pleckstrin-like domain
LIDRRRLSDRLWVIGALVLALSGLAGFILIFVRHMNVYWFILSPIIVAVYEIPAVVVYGTWKKRRDRRRTLVEIAPEEGIPQSPSGDMNP